MKENEVLNELEKLINNKNKEIIKLKEEVMVNQKYFFKIIRDLRWEVTSAYKPKIKKQVIKKLK